MQRAQVLTFAEKQWGILPDHPWGKTPDSTVLRHPVSGKWFGLIMSVNRKTLHMSGEGTVNILNVKCDPLMVPSLQKLPGYLPAYHMNRQHWLTLVLDGSVPLQDVCYLLTDSHDLTRPALLTRKNHNHDECLCRVKEDGDGS